MKAYLSIDLDFWNIFDFPKAYFDRLVATGLPITVVSQHHHLLPHISLFDGCFDTLVNLDYHSDIADREEGTRKFSRQVSLECGTWVNHIRGSDRHYIWSYPQVQCFHHGSGTCHSSYNPFTVENPEEVCGWTKISHRLLWYPRLCDVVAIGIAVSKGWAEPRLVREFIEWKERHPKLPRVRITA